MENKMGHIYAFLARPALKEKGFSIAGNSTSLGKRSSLLAVLDLANRQITLEGGDGGG